jgi:arginase family enzyme
MRTALLHLDGALGAQDDLCARVAGAGGTALDLRDLEPDLRLWARPDALDRLSRRLEAELPEGPVLAFAGSGDFHHVTALLLARACAQAGAGEVTVLHFDNHPDWVRFGRGLHCGSWVARAAQVAGVAKVITVGVCSHDIRAPRARQADPELIAGGRLELYAYPPPPEGAAPTFADRWPAISSLGAAAFAALLATRVESPCVYLTVDKDVLRPDDAATNWDQGQLSLDDLETLVRAACEGRRLIGADVVGDWSAPAYGGGLDAALKRGEAWLDQPQGRPEAEALAGNAATNLRLMTLIEALAA